MSRVLSRIELAINDRLHRGKSSVLRGAYKKTIDSDCYNIFEPCFGGKKVVAAFEDKVVLMNMFNSKYIEYYPYVKNSFSKRRIRLNAATFPGLIDDSKILKCCFIPFMRQVSELGFEKSVRFVVITDKGQIYHNYPARNNFYDGKILSGDEFRFEESVIWDLPERKHPSESEMCDEYEIYYPNLPKECYEYHPVYNKDPSYNDVYGNGGFGRYTYVEKNGEKVKASRFYLYSRDAQANPFHFIGGGDPNYKMTIIGTYRSNVTVGVRICVFATTDGGRIWNCKYEFGDIGEYKFRQGDTSNWGHNFGNPIQFINYTTSDWEGLCVKKRVIVSPSEKEKNPSVMFEWNEASTVKYAAASESGQLLITTISPHRLSTGNVIAFKCTDSDKSFESVRWAINNSISGVSGGTGVLFKVEVINDYTFALYEFVSSCANNITCRHIHHINRTRDGWIIGSGEIYPNSWLLYFQLKKADTFSKIDSSDEFQILRINASENSIQRTMGVILCDDREETIVYASDHDDLKDICVVKVPDSNVSFSRNNTGIYRGSLRNINDRSSFECIKGMSEPCFYFQCLRHYWIFCGQRGELAISINEGHNWKIERINAPIIHYFGHSGEYFYFDSCVVQRKC